MVNICPAKIPAFISSVRSLADDLETMTLSTPEANQSLAAEKLLEKYGCL